MTQLVGVASATCRKTIRFGNCICTDEGESETLLRSRITLLTWTPLSNQQIYVSVLSEL